MGNKTFIKSAAGDEMGIYIRHFNDTDWLSALLKYCEFQGFPGFGEGRDEVAFACLTQVVSNLRSPCWEDIGVTTQFSDRQGYHIYEVEGWRIARHVVDGVPVEEEKHSLCVFDKMFAHIDRKQPENLRFGRAIADHNYPVKDLKLGDEVLLQSFRPGEARWRSFKVIGFGEEGRIINGLDVSGIPYVFKNDIFSNLKRWEYVDEDLNNYLLDKTCIRCNVR